MESTVYERLALVECPMYASMVSFLLIILSCTARVSYAEEQSPLSVGVILSLTGGLEQWCEPIRQGMELAASEATPSEVRLIFEDDGSGLKKRRVETLKVHLAR